MTQIYAMITKQIVLTLLGGLLAVVCRGQHIKGIILDAKSRQPIEAASVFVLKTGQSTAPELLLTNADGTFATTLPDTGTYDVKVSMLGYEPAQQPGLIVRQAPAEITIALVPNGNTELKEVEITTERSTIETQLDKKVFNVGRELIARGGNATDILNNVPSVNVNPMGAVSLRGNSSVRILINGKPSALTANNGLTQIPAETIEKVEVITNPSAEYDAQGAAGIINIVLKKNKKGGFSSSFTVHGGIPNNNGGGLNANYKTTKFNIFSDVRVAQIAFDGYGTLQRHNFENNGTSAYIDQNIRRFRNFRRLNTYVGSDIYFNEKNTLTLSYLYRYNLNRDSVFYQNLYKNDAGSTISAIQTLERYREPQRSNMMEANYVKQFQRPKQQLKFNAQYVFWNDDENENVNEFNRDLALPTETALRSRDIESSKELMAQGDFNTPVGQNGKFSIGLKSEMRRINSDYAVWENNLPVDTLTNVLRYFERIYGTYAQFSNVFKKVQYQLGVRVEHFNTGSNDLKNIFYTRKKYTNVFPSAHLTFKATKRLDLQLSYSKRIDRPGFFQINPFGGIADRRNLRVGNPDLNPMFIDVAELGTLFKFENGLVINPSAYFQYTKNLFDILITRNTANVLIEKPINLGTERRYGFELSTTFSPYKWWSLSNDINAYRFVQNGVFTVTDAAWFTKLNSRIKSGKWSVQNAFNFTGARSSGQIRYRAVFFADLAIGRELWNDKGMLTLRGDNILGTRIHRYTVNSAVYTLSNETRPYGARVVLSFNYKLNRTKADKDRLPE